MRNGIEIEHDLRELYRKRDVMLQEIGLLLEDTATLNEIGDMNYLEFTKYVYDRYEALIPAGKIIQKIRGHRMELIKYYCETFNAREE